MKFILFNLNDTNKCILRKIYLDKNNDINEISLSKKILTSLDDSPKKIIEKIRYYLYNRKIEKEILKALEGYNKKWNYILCKSLINNKYLSTKLQQFLGYKIPVNSELDDNINKYIEEYLIKAPYIKVQDVKILLVVNNDKNLNISLVKKLITEYKTVNIYLKDKPSEYLLKKIKQINNDEGTAIELIKQDKKSFKEYNVVYFVDDNRKKFPRLRIDKNSLVVDQEMANKDKFNSNIIYINDCIEKQCINTNNIKTLINDYDILEVAIAIKKILN